jgi:hypothetical protein
VNEHLMYRREFFIGGAWEGPAGGDRLGVISPSTEEVVGEVPLAGPEGLANFLEPRSIGLPAALHPDEFGT